MEDMSLDEYLADLAKRHPNHRAVRELVALRVDSTRLQGVVDELTKNIIFKCSSCLTVLKDSAVHKQDFEAADQYRQLLDALP